MTSQPPKQDPNWHATISKAADHVDEGDSQLADVQARRERAEGESRTRRYLLLLLPVLAAVAAWNAWAFTRPPDVPPDADIGLALRETAGALAREALALAARQGRLPPPAELGEELDDELTYELVGEGFVVTNTDGVIQVRYDGSRPVDDWVASGGYTRVEEIR